MQDVKELTRRPAPGARPQPLAFDGTFLWTGSWETDHIYQIDPKTGATVAEFPAPGKPYGLAFFGGELRVVVAIGDDDDRFLFRFKPGAGFDMESKVACPDFTGSHLASDGESLYLGQMHDRRIVVMDAGGKIEREIPLPTRIGGMGFREGTLYIIAADEEFENLRLATLDERQSAPQAVEVAIIPFDARSLAYDGSAWWTNHREASQIVSFSV